MAEEVEGKTVTAELRNQPISEVLDLLARRLGVSVRIDGDLIFFGVEKPQDRAVMVRRVRRVKSEQLKEIVGVVGTGKAASFADGLVVVSDTVEVVKRINEALSLVEDAAAPVWIVQLHIVGYTADAADRLGINIEPAAKAGLAFALGSANPIGAGTAAVRQGVSLNVSGSLDAVLAMAHSRQGVSVTAAPMFLLCDGAKSSFVQGDRIPIPRRQVAPETGAVTTTGFEYIQTGVQVELALREYTPASALIETSVKISDQKGMVEDAAITGEENFQTSAVVKAGGVYLLGTLAKDRVERGTSLGWINNFSAADKAQVIQVWLQCYRIGGAVGEIVQPVPVVPSSISTPPGDGWHSLDLGESVYLKEKPPEPVKAQGAAVGVAG